MSRLKGRLSDNQVVKSFWCQTQEKYASAIWFWVQEEPLNMGAASFLVMNLKAINFGIISRTASAATATGYAKVHAAEQAELIETAFK